MNRDMELRDFLALTTDDPQAALQFSFLLDLHLRNSLGIQTGAFPRHAKYEPYIHLAITNFFNYQRYNQINSSYFNGPWKEIFELLLLEMINMFAYLRCSKQMKIIQMDQYAEKVLKAHNAANEKLLDNQ